jgi:hypothetical protein
MLNEIKTPIGIPSRDSRQLKKNQNNPTFKSINWADGFVKSQDNLKVTRFFQDVATNWVPKAVFTRSLPDFAEMSFLEYTESSLFYFAPAFFGKIFRKAFLAFHPKELKKIIDSNIPKSAEKILEDKSLKKDDAAKRIISTKAAIILACTAIPAGEYALSFAKNLFTLKLFKKSDFNNIANLNKEQIEHKEQQEKVRISAIRHIKNAGLLSLGGLGASVIFAKYGHKSDILQKASSLILQPGAHIANGLKKIGLHSDGVEKFLKKYITPDFDEKDGKLTLSKGQLLVSTVSGFFGYSEAGKDRGRLDQLEVLTRVPFVILYTVFGSAVFDHLFNKALIKKNIFPDVIKKDAKDETVITETKDLGVLAEKIAKNKNTSKEIELNRLIKQKAIIKGVPYLFGIVFMGFLLAGITRFWTQYRFKHLKESEQSRKS